MLKPKTILIVVLIAVFTISGTLFIKYMSCWLNFDCYELYIWGEPEFAGANIYLDNKLIEKSVNGSLFLDIPYGEREIKVIQKGYKPFITVLEGGPGRIKRRLLVKFESLDSGNASLQKALDTLKIEK